MIKAIDVWCNFWPPEAAKRFCESPELAYASKIEKLDPHGFSLSPEEAVAGMDEAGVEVAFISGMKQGYAFRMGPGWSRDRMLLDFSFKESLIYTEKYPERFRCLYGINPWTMMDGLKELEIAVKDYGFVGAVSHVAGFAPYNDKIWYPFYAKCCELDIPIISQIGHFGEMFPQGYGHPLLIDEVALHFPELRIIGGHTGWPWCNELIAEALKNENVYISMEAHLPRYYEPAMVRYINTRGQDKVMWGTDYPITRWKKNLEQLEELGLREEAKKKFLRDNAIRIFKLNLPLA